MPWQPGTCGNRMTPTCEALERYPGGFMATGEALARPGEWIAVYQLRPLEVIPYILGIPFKPFHAVTGIIYDPHDRCFWSLPASRVPDLSDGVLRRRTFLGWVWERRTLLRPVWERCASVDGWFYRASERLEHTYSTFSRSISAVFER